MTEPWYSQATATSIGRLRAELSVDGQETQGAETTRISAPAATYAFDGYAASVNKGYAQADDLSMKPGEGRWTKVSGMREGQEIAVQGKNNNAVWDRIEKIERLPAEQVWDLEIAGTHNFVANGIVAHNTYLGTASATGVFTSTATGANTFPYASTTALTASGTGYFGTASTTSLFSNAATIGTFTGGNGSFAG